ncbi:hypothetical protein Y032_0692g1582 [Ancylostoma ceylanicum]|uniref:Uncharacterized protein n=2 Tax=Ancylostoma ceylanicum TaxID=53326 RepID=A0A016WGR6_9BILA|nr:hypothetical protein Y032_0692g1582 [Ancylostoma ceylanicum]
MVQEAFVKLRRYERYRSDCCRFHALISAAINRVTTTTNNERRNTGMPLCIANLRSSYFNSGTTLPSYEEALSMGSAPNSDVIPNNSQRAPPYEAVVPKNERLLRYEVYRFAVTVRVPPQLLYVGACA